MDEKFATKKHEVDRCKHEVQCNFGIYGSSRSISFLKSRTMDLRDSGGSPVLDIMIIILYGSQSNAEVYELHWSPC
jgi:hypothetical protein